MSKIAIYGDAHITKKMNTLQDRWNTSVISIFQNLYSEFESANVEYAVCLGDFFDKAVLEAKSVTLVMQVLDIVNKSTFPTFFLLGNHEIDSHQNNILEYLSEYQNIFPVTELKHIESMTFIPYNVDIDEVPEDFLRDSYVFTHHDIYGSELANGKLKASFGIDPNVFSISKFVFNGHIHLASRLGNIYNVGSILKSQHGELRKYENPQYYILDTVTGSVESFLIKENFIAYQTVRVGEIPGILSKYEDSVYLVLRVEYKSEEDLTSIEDYRSNPRILRLNLRKLLDTSSGAIATEISRTTLDIKEFITDYIKKDISIEDPDKPKMIELGLSLLGG